MRGSRLARGSFIPISMAAALGLLALIGASGCDKASIDRPSSPSFRGEEQLDLSEFTLACELATEAASPQLIGDLSDAAYVGSGLCELSGYVQVFRLTPDRHARHHFEPWVGAFWPRTALFTGSCQKPELIACSMGEALDTDLMPAGSPLYLAVGTIDGESFEPPEEGAPFQVDHRSTPELELGAICYAWSTLSCPAGTACLDDEGQPLAATGEGRCTVVEGSRCGFARPVEISPDGPAIVEFASLSTAAERERSGLSGAGDEHRHSCMLEPSEDWVLRIEPSQALIAALAQDTETDFELRISGTPTGVGFALRGPHCAPNQEFACEPLDPAGVRPTGLSVDARRAFALGAHPYLIVEVPPPGGPARVVLSIFAIPRAR